MPTTTFTRMLAPAILCTTLLGAGPAQAESEYPTRPITLVVPLPAGSDTDTIARLMADGLGRSLKQPVVVENRVGAGGQIAMKYVATAKPDGYTLAAPFQAALTLVPHIRKTPPYDPRTDFTPIGRFGSLGIALVVPEDSPFKSFDQLIAKARAEPGKLTFASFGVGSGGHLAGEMLNAAAGLSIVHVPYKGTSEARVGLLRKEVDMAILGDGLAALLVHDGKARALAVPQAARSPLFPDAPTFREAGIPLATQGWVGLAGPAGLPADVVQKLEAALKEAASTPGLSERLGKIGLQLAPTDAAGFSRIIQDDYALWGKAVDIAGIEKN
ncbi:Bug family tripartite tricarboxylate transporter substrate binding protein [Achromobacter sp.]|uniref:Bug family tripartite tricarboxylate transporter substrate binding protein n=1 Tax=Achromobacter sp. TaxID=134375 RepID=UPI003C7287E1